MTTPHDISIVIPTHADNAPLLALLAAIRRWPHQPGEVIVVDGANNAAVHAICRRHAVTWLRSVPGRGIQLMKGASQASGSVLWFLHADASPDTDSIEAIIDAVDSGAVGGCFTFRFIGGTQPIKSVLERCIAWRVRMGIPYGDQGIFATRAAFDVCGGFAPTPLFEEVPLVKRLRRYGRFYVLRLPIFVSDRRWRRDGWLARTLCNRLLVMGYMLGVPPARLSRWYGRDRTTT